MLSALDLARSLDAGTLTIDALYDEIAARLAGLALPTAAGAPAPAALLGGVVRELLEQGAEKKGRYAPLASLVARLGPQALRGLGAPRGAASRRGGGPHRRGAAGPPGRGGRGGGPPAAAGAAAAAGAGVAARARHQPAVHRRRQPAARALGREPGQRRRGMGAAGRA